jgi:hypothetical protein
MYGACSDTTGSNYGYSLSLEGPAAALLDARQVGLFAVQVLQPSAAPTCE